MYLGGQQSNLDASRMNYRLNIRMLDLIQMHCAYYVPYVEKTLRGVQFK